MRVCNLTRELCVEAVGVDRRGALRRTGAERPRMVTICRMTRIPVEDLTECPMERKVKDEAPEAQG
jgi:hypothetical protein